MSEIVFKSDGLRVTVDTSIGCLSEIAYNVGGEYVVFLTSDREFCTSAESCNGKAEIGKAGVVIRAETEYFSAESKIKVDGGCAERVQVYTIKKEFDGFICPGFVLEDKQARYSYSLRVYDRQVMDVSPQRNDYLWALPLPAHLWHGKGYAAAYCLDREEGVGTCDFEVKDGKPYLRVYYPDSTCQETEIMPFSDTNTPKTRVFRAGGQIRFTERIAFAPLGGSENPLLKSEKLAAEMLLRKKTAEPDYAATAERIARYYKENGLFSPDALGKGKGWYRNMWKHTDGGTPEKDFYYDLGWGEGYGVLTLSALVRYSVRTGSKTFREQIGQITRNMHLFLRNASEPGAYYDRFVPKGKPTLLGKYNDYECCDFLGIRRIWTHSLAMIGYQLITLYEDVADYDEELRGIWMDTANDIGDFLLKKQRADGDINDGFDERDAECNKKRHRIPARAIACALFAGLYRVKRDKKYLDAAVKLAYAVAPEIMRYEFYNQMLDAHVDVIGGEIVESGQDDVAEVYDAENACYAIAGLADVYAATKDEKILKLCENCASYLISWMYFYDIKTGVNGRARGATTCRMPDFPLVYLGAGNFAWQALKTLAALTGEAFYEQIAEEMFRCAADYQLKAPGKPWDSGIVHAVYQVNGKHWGPQIEGQMDTGMTSGSTLMNIEKYLGGNGK